MNRYPTFAAATVLLALTACGGGDQAGNPAGNASGNDQAAAGDANLSADDAKPAEPVGNAQPGSDSNAASGAPVLDRAFMVGRWTEEGDCSMDAAEFRADGNFVFPWGDAVPWQLNGDQLSLTGNPRTFTVQVVDRNTLRVDKGGGSVRNWTRC